MATTSTHQINAGQSLSLEVPVEKVFGLQGSTLVRYGVTHTLLAEGESTEPRQAGVTLDAMNGACRATVTNMPGY